MTDATMTLADLNEAIARRVFGCEESFASIATWYCYATNITEAWKVVDAVRAKGYHCDIGSKADGWSAFFWMPKGRAPHVVQHGATAAEAICRAALEIFVGAEA